MGAMELFKGVLLATLFYSVAITIITYTCNSVGIPLHQVTSFTDIGNNSDMQAQATQIQTSLTRFTSTPIIEVGALVFFSGNIILDLLLNFVTAIPQMIGLVLHGLQMILGIDTTLWAYVELFATIVVTLFFFVGIIELITNIRSRGAVI